MKFLLAVSLAIAVISCHKPKNNFGRQFQTLIDGLSGDSTELFGKYPTTKRNVFIINPPLDGTNTNALIVNDDSSVVFRASIANTSSRSSSLEAFEEYHRKIDRVLDNSFIRDYEDISPLPGNTIRRFSFTSGKIEIVLTHSKSTLDNKYQVSLQIFTSANKHSTLDSNKQINVKN